MAWLKKIFNIEDEELAPAPEGELGEDLGEAQDTAEGGQLAIDVYQDKDNVYVKSTIAGVKPEDLDISISNETVSISGQRQLEEEIKDQNYIYQECYWGKFYRSFALPMEIDPDRAEAELKDGILTLTLPKASRSRTKKVRVRGEE